MSFCSAPCAIHKGFSEPEYTVLQTPSSSTSSASATLRGPSKEQLASLTHLLPSLARNANRTSKKGKKTIPTVRDGQIVAKLFNVVAGRPHPSLGSLEQGLTCTLSLAISAFSTSTTVPVYGAFTFALSQCSSASQYTSLFDQYRIEQLEVWMEPLSESTSVSATMMATCIDLDDSNVPASYGEVADRQGALQATSLTARYHKWKPHCATAIYSGAFTSYENVVAPWIDVASPGVYHYGLKYATGGSDGLVRTFNVSVRAVVSFRGPAI